jgi:hypothetical protein
MEHNILNNYILTQNNYKNNLIIINGVWGTGKSMIAPIIETFDNIENFKIVDDFELVLNSLKLKKINNDAASFIIHSYCKRNLYHRMLGREINFRFKDDSGPKTFSTFLKYIKRLFLDDNKVYDKIEANENILLFMTHNLFTSHNDIFTILNQNIKFIEIVRHPAFLLKHWETYFNRWNSNKEFTFAYNYNNYKIPWFLTKNQDDFILLNDLEKSILCISELYNEIFDYLCNEKTTNENIIILPFEAIALQTNSIINILEKFLEKKSNTILKSVLRKQKLPRENLLNGLGKSKYGFKNDKLSDLSFIKNSEEDVEKRTNLKIFNLYKETVIKYNNFFPIKYK